MVGRSIGDGVIWSVSGSWSGRIIGRSVSVGEFSVDGRSGTWGFFAFRVCFVLFSVSFRWLEGVEHWLGV